MRCGRSQKFEAWTHAPALPKQTPNSAASDHLAAQEGSLGEAHGFWEFGQNNGRGSQFDDSRVGNEGPAPAASHQPQEARTPTEMTFTRGPAVRQFP